MVRKYEGVASSSEVSALRVREDLRPLLTRLRDWWLTPDGQSIMLMAMLVLGIVMVWAPLAGELVLMLVLCFSWLQLRYKKRKWDFPLRVPMSADLIDGSTNKKGKGIMFVGNEVATGMPASISDNDARTHALIFGTTGSGKTVFLMGFVVNSLIFNGGASYTDGKGDVKLWLQFMNACRMFGREDDLLLISFITSGHEFYDRQESKISNTINPYATGSSGMCTEASIALMDSGGGGDDMWKGRAIAFLGGLIKPMVFLRDQGEILLDADLIREYFDLSKLERLVWDEEDTWKGGLKRDRGYFYKKYGKVWKAVIRPLEAFMITIPGYDKGKLGKQEQKTVEQHGYITMQLARLFGDVADNYGHIMKTPLGEVDMYDVVINDRILVTLLPALERSPESLGMLGKIIVGGIKQMAAGCLGNKVEGMRREIVDARPTNSPVPFPTIFDEYGYYAVLGFAAMPAQARSLGFMVVFAAQDFASLKKSSPEEADQTWENTNLRGVGRITSGSASETYKRMSELGGSVPVAELEGYEVDRSGMFAKIRASDRIRVVDKPRVSSDDLHSQNDGEFHLFLGKKEKGAERGVMKVVRVAGFFSEVGHDRGDEREQPAVELLSINHFARVSPPAEIISAMTNAMVKGDNGIRAAIANNQLYSSIKANESKNAMLIMAAEMHRMNAELQAPLSLLDLGFVSLSYLDKYEGKRKSDLLAAVSEAKLAGAEFTAVGKPAAVTTLRTDSGGSSSDGGPAPENKPVIGVPPVEKPRAAAIGRPPVLGRPPIGGAPMLKSAAPAGPSSVETAAQASEGASKPLMAPVTVAQSASQALPSAARAGEVGQGGEGKQVLQLSDEDKETLAKINLFTKGEVSLPVNNLTADDLVALAQDLLAAGNEVFGGGDEPTTAEEVVESARATGQLEADVKPLDKEAIIDVIRAVEPEALGPDEAAKARAEARDFVNKMALGSTYLETPQPNSGTSIASFRDAVDVLAETVWRKDDE